MKQAAETMREQLAEEDHRADRVEAHRLAARLISEWIEDGLPARHLAEAFIVSGSSALVAIEGREVAVRRMRRIADNLERGVYSAAGRA